MQIEVCIFVLMYIFCVVMGSSGEIIARLVCVCVCVWHFQPITGTCGWFLLVQELNDKPLGFVCVHSAVIKGVWV